MSGHAGEAIAEHGLDDGKLLRKPSPLDAILRKVREALDRQSERPPATLFCRFRLTAVRK